MSDSYNSNFTGREIDDTINKVATRGVSVRDSAITLEENHVIVGDTGGKNIKSSDVTLEQLEAAVSGSGALNVKAVTADDPIDSGKVLVSAGTRKVVGSSITNTDLQNAVSYSGTAHEVGLMNGPKHTDPTDDLTPDNLVAYGEAASNEIIDTGIPASTLTTMTVGIPEEKQYLRISELPGLTKNSKINITAALDAQGSASAFGSAVLYYGRNFYDVGHVRTTVSAKTVAGLGARNTAYTITHDNSNRLYVPDKTAGSTGFTEIQSTSSYTSAKSFIVYREHEYLIIYK